MAKIRDIGVDVQPPPREGKPGDPFDPFYGTLSVRGQQIVGQIVGTKMQGSVLVQREYTRYIPKYERFEKRTSRYTAHVPSCIDAQVGDHVTIMECRPISKQKKYVVIEARRGELHIKGMEAVEATEGAATAPSEEETDVPVEEEGEAQ